MFSASHAPSPTRFPLLREGLGEGRLRRATKLAPNARPITRLERRLAHANHLASRPTTPGAINVTPGANAPRPSLKLKVFVVQVEIVKTIEVAHLGCSPSTFRGSVRQPLSCS